MADIHNSKSHLDQSESIKTPDYLIIVNSVLKCRIDSLSSQKTTIYKILAYVYMYISENNSLLNSCYVHFPSGDSPSFLEDVESVQIALADIQGKILEEVKNGLPLYKGSCDQHSGL